ncbi:MAG: glycosyltransferase [Methanolinea sp.]|nr:glycosyltransferase [Methanolinea sp.]
MDGRETGKDPAGQDGKMWAGTARVAVFGPSKRFLSGITYFTIRLANALSSVAKVDALLFRHMLPKKLFPGWKRVGKDLSAEGFLPGVGVHEVMDWYNPVSWMKAYAVARKSDMVILPWWTSSVAHMYLFIQALTWKRRLVMIEFHEPVDPLEDASPPLRVYARVTGWLVRSLAGGFVTHTRYDRDLIVGRYHIPARDIHIIPHGLYDQYTRVDQEEARKALGIGEDYVILFFGLLRKFKGVRYLIEAFELLPPPLKEKSRLCIVGEAWEDQESVDMARRSPDRDRISIVDRYISDREVSLYYSAADVFAGPYTRESHDPCAVCHIAMSFGLPVIASRTGGMVESLGSYEGVFFVPPEDPGALREALEVVYRGRDKRYPVPEDLRWENIALRWRDIFLEKMAMEGRKI